MKIVILCGGYGTRLSEETKINQNHGKIENFRSQSIIHFTKKFGFNEFILVRQRLFYQKIF